MDLNPLTDAHAEALAAEAAWIARYRPGHAARYPARPMPLRPMTDRLTRVRRMAGRPGPAKRAIDVRARLTR
jgi:hypothetical protein